MSSSVTSITVPIKVYEDARKLYHDKKFDEALRMLDSVINTVPQSQVYTTYSTELNGLVNCYNLRALIYQNFSKDFKAALADYEMANLYEKFLPTYLKACLCYNRGSLMEALRRHDEALTLYSQALTLNPNYCNAYNNRGALLEDLKRYEESLYDYSKAIELKGDEAVFFNNRGHLYMLMKKFDDAIADLTHAIELEPNSASAYGHRALVGFEQGNFKQAEEDADKSLSMDTKYPRPFYVKACLARESGKLQEAFDYICMCKRLKGGTLDLARRIDSKFNTLLREVTWSTVRLMWIGKLKDNEALFNLLPREILLHILYFYYDSFNIETQ